MEYFNFHEEGTLRRVQYQKKAPLSCTAASAMPKKCNFWRLFRSQSIKTRGSPWDSGFEEVWPPSSLDGNWKHNFLCGASERDVNRSPHNKMQPLITSIWEVLINLPREDFKRSYSWFRSRLEEAVAAEDYLFCYLFCLYEKEKIRKVSLRYHSLRIFCNSFCKLKKTGFNTARTLYITYMPNCQCGIRTDIRFMFTCTYTVPYQVSFNS